MRKNCIAMPERTFVSMVLEKLFDPDERQFPGLLSLLVKRISTRFFVVHSFFYLRFECGPWVGMDDEKASERENNGVDR